MGKRVVMLVATDLVHDNRVRKQAETLAAAGYRVSVFSYIARDAIPCLNWGDRPNLAAIPAGRAPWAGRQGPVRAAAHGVDLLRWGGNQALLAPSREAQAEVYHAHDLDTLAAASWLARRWGGKLVYDSHELFVEMMAPGPAARSLPWQSRVKQWLSRRNYARHERALIGHASAVITVSGGIADELVRRYGIARPHLVLNAPPYRTVDHTLNYLRQRLGLGPDRHILLQQGAMLPDRGQLELLQALAILPEAYVLVFLGFNLGVYQEAIRQEMARLGLAERVFLLDALPPGQLLAATASADLGTLLLSGENLNNRLALPNKLFEYMMAGLPFVATRWPEIERVVRATGAGVLLDGLAPRDIATAVQAALSDPARRRAMREAGLAAARKTYNWETQAACLLELYARLFE